MKLVWSAKFTRAAKRATRKNPGLLDDLSAALELLEADHRHPSLETHKSEARAISPSPLVDCRRVQPSSLTPALSRWEREPRRPPSSIRYLPALRSLAAVLPLPAGEGRGEGERLRRLKRFRPNPFGHWYHLLNVGTHDEVY